MAQATRPQESTGSAYAPDAGLPLDACRRPTTHVPVNVHSDLNECSETHGRYVRCYPTNHATKRHIGKPVYGNHTQRREHTKSPAGLRDAAEVCAPASPRYGKEIRPCIGTVCHDGSLDQQDQSPMRSTGQQSAELYLQILPKPGVSAS